MVAALLGRDSVGIISYISYHVQTKTGYCVTPIIRIRVPVVPMNQCHMSRSCGEYMSRYMKNVVRFRIGIGIGIGIGMLDRDDM